MAAKHNKFEAAEWRKFDEFFGPENRSRAERMPVVIGGEVVAVIPCSVQDFPKRTQVKHPRAGNE